MRTDIFVKSFLPPEYDRAQICRYAGAAGQTDIPLLDECLSEAEKVLTYKVCFCEVPVKKQDGMLDLAFCRTSSKGLERTLSGCGRAILFAACVGTGIDRLMIANRVISPAKALIFDAIGSERAEALCDAFQRTFPHTTPRFSPGYGDLPLECQQDIFSYLAPGNKIGLTLNERLLMSPSKSVTAIFGIKESEILEDNRIPEK